MTRIITPSNEQILLDYFLYVHRSSQPISLAMDIDNFIEQEEKN